MIIPKALAATSVVNKGNETASQSSAAVTDFLSFLWDRLDNWIAAIVVAIFALYFAKVFRKIIINKITDQVDDGNEDIIVLAGRATYAGILSVGMTVALKVAGIDLTAVIAAVGFGIGFAMQDLIMNFIAGVLILISHPFKLGDLIKVNDVVGRVTDIQSRSTVLQALDGTRVVVPNSDLINKQITSFTSNPFRRVDLPVGVEYSTDLSKAMNIAKAVMDGHPSVIKEPGPNVILDEFADSSINLILRFWVPSKSSWLSTKTEIINQLKKAFDSAGISIPFPIRTVYMHNEGKNTTADIQKVEETEALIQEDTKVDPAPPMQSAIANPPIDQTIQAPAIPTNTASDIDSSHIEIHQIIPPENISNPQQDFRVLPPIEEHKDISGADFLSNL